MANDLDPRQYLASAEFVDSGNPGVAGFAREVAGSEGDSLARAVRLYYAVRDDIVYTPYCDFTDVETFRASACLSRRAGFCVGKASLLTADRKSVV